MSQSVTTTWTCELCEREEIIEESKAAPEGWQQLLVRCGDRPREATGMDLFLGDVCTGCAVKIKTVFSLPYRRSPVLRKLLEEMNG